MVSQDNESRGRILKAAEAEFAEKGFDGSRVDAIAARAGVNKALLYYYFPNKAGLLETLVADWLEGLRKAKEGIPVPSDGQGMRDYGRQVVRAVLDFTKGRLDLIRVVIQEELKGNARTSLIVEVWKAEWERSTAWFVDRGLGEPPPPGQDVFNCFFEDLPLLMFLLVNQKWSRAMGRDPEATEQTFLALAQAQSDAYWNRRYPHVPGAL